MASIRTDAGRAARRALALAALLALAGCGLPRAGPSISEIEAQDTPTTLPFEVIAVTDEVARRATRSEARSFEAAFLRSPVQDVNLIGPGDSLAIAVWENVENGVLTGVGQKVVTLPDVQVDLSGFIYVPYVGRIRAAGNSPDSLRRIITEGLKDQTPDPQVEVRRLITGSATVSVIGAVGAPGVYPIEPSTRRLLAMLAKAGGVNIEPEVAVLSIRRGTLTGRIWLQDLFDRPEFDVALRASDAVVVERDRRSFTALGSLGQQQRVPFPTRTIHALEALGLVGGLNTQVSDPRGIFVFRTEDPAIAEAVLPGRAFPEPVRVVYAIDLVKPGGMFTASSFEIRDGDVVYVTEAPFVRFQRILQTIAPLVSFAGSINNLSGGALRN